VTTILYAQSLDLNIALTADEADQYGAEGKIRASHRFVCPDKNCDAQITCANLFKPFELRKKPPYFIYVGDHTDECEIGKRIKIEEREQRERRNSQPLKYISEGVQFLNLDIPSDTKITSITGSSGSNKSNTDTSVKRNTSNPSGKRPSNKRISGWVKDYKNDADVTLSIGDQEIHIQDLFVPITKDLDINSLPDEPRIYFGKLWVDTTHYGFKMTFENKVTINNINQCPSFFISANKIKNLAPNADFSDKKLNSFAVKGKKVPLTFYIFSFLPPHLDKNDTFINFYAKELTYLYYDKYYFS
jgi:hypothetical protein